MLAWKEKVAEKLSRLLADSPAFPSSTYPAADPQAISFSTEHFSSLKKPSLSSYVLPFLPTSNSNSVHEGRSPCSESMRPLPSESLPKRWRENDFTWNDRPPELSECGSESERDERNENSCNIHVLPQYRSVGNSNGNESSTSDSADARHLLTEKSAFVSSNLFEFFQSSLPGTSKGCHWVLLYSTWKHGISLRTLLRRSENLQGPCLLVVGDMQGAVFGGLLHSPLKPTEKEISGNKSNIRIHYYLW